GKGGTGKTTISVALACALATAGRRVLVCEVEGRHGITDLFGRPPLDRAEEPRLSRTPSGGAVHGLAIDAEDALLEYLESFYHLGFAAKALDRFGAMDFATSIAPGLRDVLLTGKVYEAVRRQAKGRDDAYDAVILDAPPTGRIAQFLNIHEAVSGLAKVGPIRSQADSINAMLRAPTTVVHLVTLLEDMPVTETEEAIDQLRATQITVGTVIANMVRSMPLSDGVLQTFADGNGKLAVPGFDEADNKILAAEFGIEATRTVDHRRRRAVLDGFGKPVAEVAFDPGGIDENAVFAIADQLQDQMQLERRR
ncbi:MAG TPA: ArsA-related P-loop ATPase, partial [Microlunatus sp.]|nr:ArsA-related P-loop ATPase [Microlunatus sp.]